MITPKQTTYYELEILDHAGPESLDAIATRVYGRRCQGARTGGNNEYNNDSYSVHDMTETGTDYLDGIEGIDSKDTYIGYEPSTYTSLFAPMAPLDYWLSLEGERPHYIPEDRWDVGDDYKVAEAAPHLVWVLADLIRKGELPHGMYLLHCWW